MNRLSKAAHMNKKDLPGTLLFVALMLGIVLLIAGQDTRNNSTMVSQQNPDSVVTVDTEDTRLVNAEKTQETTVQ
jgi:hypothetical protein